MKTLMKKPKIKSIASYLDSIEEVKSDHFSENKQYNVKQEGDILFRGQERDENLLPKIARLKMQYWEIAEIEKKMLAEIVRIGSIYRNFDKLNIWDIMTVAQHYGMSTRLLDWTRNPLTALWFACKNSRRQKPYVYVLLPRWDIEILDQSTEESLEKIQGISILKPNFPDSRIVAQDGWFTIHGISRKHGKFFDFQDRNGCMPGVIKIVIDPHATAEILKSLDILGVNHHNLFPDLGGICSHINWSLTSKLNQPT